MVSAPWARFCPRCDNRYVGDTKALANALVREHLVKAEAEPLDELHIGALEQWDDMTKQETE